MSAFILTSHPFALAAHLPARAPRAAPAVPRVAVRASAALNPDAEKEAKAIKEVKAGEKFPVCRCWKSKKFPMCDGSHNAWNKENGDNIGPLVISVPKTE
eukprot:CAMPEP_0174885488 /NCGR_PEP_ID=MMETSP0167-20121228/737_1 /TAXON_ID=38298 /ORGANISM="Rhodella maculata, Strain CCMP736" /LENGTH=99 /DNA_ID=CAMNT_0016121067 /DNA_START=15 /DNA_END=314 /DNA_ORIENTATION=-